MLNLNQTVTVLARFLGISGFIPLILLIFYTKTCIGINESRHEKCYNFGTVKKINYFCGFFFLSFGIPIFFASYSEINSLICSFYYSASVF
jgi:hypothetical protein